MAAENGAIASDQTAVATVVPAGTAAGPDSPASTPAAPSAQDAQGSGKSPEAGEAKAFTQEQVNAIVAARLAEEKAKNLKATEAAQAKAKADTLKEQGEYKTLYEETAAKLEQEQKARRELELTGLRREAGAKYKLPTAWADRLRGETLEELEADAKALSATLPKPGAPNMNDLPGGGAGTGAVAKTEAEIAAISSALGIPAQYLK